MRDTRLDVTTDKNERQLEQHGFAAFPIAFYQGDLVHNTIVWHWHDELEIIMIHRGNITIGAGGTSVELKTGEGCLIKSGVLHNAWKTDSSPCEYRSTVFHPRLIGSMDSIYWINCIQPFEASDFLPITCFSNPETDGFSSFFSQLWKTYEEKNNGYENDVRYLLTGFLMRLSDAPAHQIHRPSERELRDMERMKAMLSFLKAHFSEELTLKQIAKSASISETECMRCFRRSIGISPIRFLKEYRLQTAAGMLRSSERSVSEIAAFCGFLDMSYFTKSFRLLYGKTPTSYRNLFS